MQRFAFELRKLRREAGSPTYRVMATGAGYSIAALARAAAGETLPSLPLTLAYVKACGGDLAEWERQWHTVRGEEAAQVIDDESADPPYRGLVRFEPGDAELFFGHEELTAELEETARRHRVSALVGASGSGKSSLLRAGLVPLLRRPTEAQGVPLAAVRILTPGAHPLLHRKRLEATPGPGDTWVLVDQFEELFTLCPDAKERDAFLKLVLAARSDDSRLRVVLAVRADFFGRCAEHSALAAALKDATLLVGPMGREQYREAIVRPASAHGLIVEKELTARVIEEVVEEPGALPLMSHALLETWRRRRGRMLTLQAYESAGGLHGAIARTAEDTYTRLTPAQATLARGILLRLIGPGNGTEDTHRPTPRTEFETAGGDSAGADSDEVLDRLARARLLTLDEGHVALAHEAVISAWPRLRGWIEEDRGRLVAHRKLTEAAQTWDGLRRDPGALYRGTRLSTAEEHFASSKQRTHLTPLEDDFLQASLAAALRHNRRTRQLIATLSILVVLALTATFTAVRKASDADTQRRLALSRELAARAGAMSAQYPETAMHLALKSYRQAPTVEAGSSLLSSYAAYRAHEFTGHTDTVSELAYSPDGRTLATASDDHTVKLWDVARHRMLATLAGHIGEVSRLAFSPDGRIVASAGEDQTVRLWDVHAPRAPGILATHMQITSLAFTPDSRTLAVSGYSRGVRLWDVASRRPIRTLVGHTGAVMAVAYAPTSRQLPKAAPASSSFSRPKGGLLATAGGDRTVKLWDTSSRRAPITLGSRTDKPVYALAFSPDGRTLATAGGDRVVRLWDVATRRSVGVLTGHQERVGTVAFSADGHALVTTSGDGTVRLWDVATHRSTVLTSSQDHNTGAAFSPDSRTIAATGKSDNTTVELWDARTHRPTGTIGKDRKKYATFVMFPPEGRAHPSANGSLSPPLAVLKVPTRTSVHSARAPDGRTVASLDTDTAAVRLWDPATGRSKTILKGHTSIIRAIAFSPNGKTLATASDDRTVRLWNAASHRLIAVLKGHSGGVSTVAFSPDGRSLITTGNGNDRTIRLWDVASHHVTAVFPSHTVGVFTSAVSPDRRTLATAGYDGAVRLWDLPTRRAIATLRGHSNTVSSAAFSRDGKTLATGGLDNSVRLWDVASRRTRAVLTSHTAGVESVTFSPDGHQLATVATNGSVRLWETDPNRAADRVCTLSRAQRWAEQIRDLPAENMPTR